MNRLGRTTLSGLDDSGVERELVGFTAGDVPDMSHPIARAANARLRSEVAAMRLKLPWLATSAAIGVPLVVIQLVIWGHVLALRRLGVAPIWMMLSLFASIAVSVLVIVTVAPRIQGQALGRVAVPIVTAILRMGRCASCGYSIQAETKGEDGLVRCSECGAAWRAERIGPQPVPSSERMSLLGARAMVMASASSRSRRRDDRGQPWAPEPAMRVPVDQRWKRRMRLVGGYQLWWAIAFGLLLSLSFASIGLVARMTNSAWTVVAAVVFFAVATPLLVVGLVRRIERMQRIRRLRCRMCLACSGRLHREGDLVACSGCGGAWRQPRRARAAAMGRG